MRRRQPLAHAVQRLPGQPVVQADARHDADALRLDVDLPFGARGRPHPVAKMIVGAQEPRAIPAVLPDGLRHAVRRAEEAPGVRPIPVAGHRGHLLRRQHEQPADEH